MIASPSVLKALEDESVEIFRETAAAIRKPVMLDSIGKDSSVLLHLARKMFAPGPIPFSSMHMYTTWKFKDMIAFRDRTPKDFVFELLVKTEHQAISHGIASFSTGTSEYTRNMKTVALREGLGKHGFDAAICGSRRDEGRSRANECTIRLRTLGCYPITAGVGSAAKTIEGVVKEVTELKLSERATKLIDGDKENSMEKKRTEGCLYWINPSSDL